MKKTNIFKTLIIGAAFCFAGLTANAQFEFGLSLTGGIPTGAMGKALPQSATGVYGNAQGLMGTQYLMNSSSMLLGGAFRFGYRIAIYNGEYGEVLPYAELNFLWNRPKKAVREQYDKNDDSYPHYINLPIYIGAQYRYPVTDIIKPYAEFGIGYDALLVTNEIGKNTDDYRYKTNGSISGNVGVGCFFSDWVSVGIYYYGFGLHKVKLKDNSIVSPAVWPCETAQQHAERLAQVTDPNTRDYGTVALRLNFHFAARK